MDQEPRDMQQNHRSSSAGRPEPLVREVSLPSFTAEQVQHIERIARSENSYDPKVVVGGPRRVIR